MKKILFALMMMAGTQAFAQPSYDIMRDQTNSFLYKGLFTFEDLEKESTFEWYKLNMKDAAAPNAETATYLKRYLPDYDVVIVMGTWCDDSKAMMPKLYKTLEAANYPKSKYKMYGLDRDKKGKNGEETTYNVTLVPTVILMRNGKEAGRIVEHESKTVAEDMVAIIEKDRAAK